MKNGEIKIGLVVNLDGKPRRYLVTGVEPAKLDGAGPSLMQDYVSMRALSGGQGGSGPSSVGVGRVVLCADQAIAFEGADAAKRWRDTIAALETIGRLTVRQCGSAIVVGSDLRALAALVESKRPRSGVADMNERQRQERDTGLRRKAARAAIIISDELRTVDEMMHEARATCLHADHGVLNSLREVFYEALEAALMALELLRDSEAMAEIAKEA